MAKTRDISEWSAKLIVFFVILAIVWDIYAINYGPPGASISATMNAQMRAHPILPVLIGVLVGYVARWDSTNDNA